MTLQFDFSTRSNLWSWKLRTGVAASAFSVFIPARFLTSCFDTHHLRRGLCARSRQIALSPAFPEGCAGSRQIAPFRALDTHDLRRGLRADRANRTLACISRTRHARSPQRVARGRNKLHSRLHFAHSTRTISQRLRADRTNRTLPRESLTHKLLMENQKLSCSKHLVSQVSQRPESKTKEKAGKRHAHFSPHT